MADHVVSSRKVLLSFNPEFVDNFTGLTKIKDVERRLACQQLLAHLKQKQDAFKKDEAEGLCKELEYSIERLVRGAGSSREMARVGFTVALTHILRTFENVTVEKMLQSIKTNLLFTQQEAKHDQSQVLMGKIMVFTALVVSDRLHSSSKENIEFVVMGMLKISNTRFILKQLCTNCLIELCKRVSGDVFQNVIFPLLNANLTKGWKKCDVNDLHLVWSLSKSQPKTIGKKFLLEHWKEKSIICEANLPSFAEVSMQTAGSQPTVHLLCLEVLHEVMKSEELFQKYWRTVIDGSLITGQNSKKVLAYKLMEEALKRANSAATIQTIFSKPVLDNLCTNAPVKTHFLHGCAMQLITSMVSSAKKLGDHSVQYEVIKLLLQSPLSYRFDQLTKTRTMHSLIMQLQGDSVTSLAEICIKLFSGENVFGDKNMDINSQQQWASSTLTSLITCNGVDRSTVLSILQFLFLNAYFTVEGSSKSIPHCKVTANNENLNHTTAEAAFCKCLDHLMSHQPKVTGGQTVEGEGQSQKHAYIDTLSDVIQYAKQLLENPDVAVQRKMWSTEEKSEWQKSVVLISNIPKENRSLEDVAFQLLIMSTVLQLFKDAEDVLEVLADMRICYKKATKKRRKSVGLKTADEPEWLEVMMELFLSLLSRPSHLGRTVVSTTFKFLCPHMTREAFSLLTDVFSDEKELEDENGLIGFEDDDDIGGSDNEGSEPEEDSSDDEVEDEEEEDDDSGSEVEDDIDPALRATVKAALGGAADNSDEESDSDMSDSAMMRLDDALAAAFRSSSKQRATKEKEEKKNQLLHFRLRCLDLVQLQLKHGHGSTSLGMLIDIIQPLLVLLEYTIRDKKEQHLSKRIKEVMNVILKQNKLMIDVEPQDLADALKSYIDYSKKVSVMPVTEYLGKVGALIVKVATAHLVDSGPSPVKTRAKRAKAKEEDHKATKADLPDILLAIYEDALTEFFYNRDCRLSHLQFSCIFERYPSFAWPLQELLQKVLTDSNVRVFCKLKAAIMMALLMSKNVLKGVDENWEVYGQNLCSVILKVLTPMTAGPDAMKPKLFESALNVLYKFITVAQADGIKTDIPAEFTPIVEVAVKIGNKDLKGMCRKFLSLMLGSHVGGQKRKSDENKESDKVSSKKKAKKDKMNESIGTTHLNGTIDVQSETPKSKKKKKRKSTSLETEKDTDENDVAMSAADNDTHESTETSLVNPKVSSSKKKRTGGVSGESSLSVEELSSISTGSKTPKSSKSGSKTPKSSETVGKKTPKSLESVGPKTPKSSKKRKQKEDEVVTKLSFDSPMPSSSTVETSTPKPTATAKSPRSSQKKKLRRKSTRLEQKSSK